MNPRERERPVLTLPSHSSLLRTAFLLLLLVSATWLLGLLAVNSDTLSFHYLFAAFSCLQVGASSHLLGPLCDLCPGAATVRRGCWGRGTGGGGSPSTCTCRGGSLRSLLVPALPPGPESVRTLPCLGQDKACLPHPTPTHCCRLAQSPLVFSRNRSSLLCFIPSAAA